MIDSRILIWDAFKKALSDKLNKLPPGKFMLSDASIDNFESDEVVFIDGIYIEYDKKVKLVFRARPDSKKFGWDSADLVYFNEYDANLRKICEDLYEEAALSILDADKYESLKSLPQFLNELSNQQNLSDMLHDLNNSVSYVRKMKIQSERLEAAKKIKNYGIF